MISTTLHTARTHVHTRPRAAARSRGRAARADPRGGAGAGGRARLEGGHDRGPRRDRVRAIFPHSFRPRYDRLRRRRCASVSRNSSSSSLVGAKNNLLLASAWPSHHEGTAVRAGAWRRARAAVRVCRGGRRGRIGYRGRPAPDISMVARACAKGSLRGVCTVREGVQACVRVCVREWIMGARAMARGRAAVLWSWWWAMRGTRSGSRAASGAHAAVITGAVGSGCNGAGTATEKGAVHARVEARLRPMSCVK